MLKTLLLAAVLPLEPDAARTRYAEIQAVVEAEIRLSYARERLSWIPVYGTWLAVREQSRREALADLRARAETARLLAR